MHVRPSSFTPLRYSWRQAHPAGAFYQLDLVNQRGLGDIARRLDGGGLPGAEELERLDEAGALRPIAFAPSSYPGHGVFRDVEEAALVYRDEVEFAPWDTYKWSESSVGLSDVTALYSPWQALWVTAARSDARMSIPYSLLNDPAALTQALSSTLGDALEWVEDAWRSLDDGWRDTLQLLVRLQNRYFPFVRGSTRLAHRRESLEPYDPTDTERASFDATVVADELGVTADALAEFYRVLAFQGRFRDPILDWYLITRCAPRAQRERFTGDALHAALLYDACAVIRRFYRDLTGDLLPDVDVLHADAESVDRHLNRLLGHGHTLAYNRDDLRRVLDRAGLYPHRVHLFVEGHSEERVFTRLIQELRGDPRDVGFEITNLRGAGNAGPFRPIMRAARSRARHVAFVGDDEGQVARVIPGLITEGVLEDGGTLIWKRNLEEDNFSPAELVELAGAAAMQKGAALSMTEADLLEAQANNPRVGLTETLTRLAGTARHGAVGLSKLELADEIADSILREVERDGVDHTASRRPVFEFAVRVARVL